MSHTEPQKSPEASKSNDLTSLGPYKIDSRLGQGGMGIVYLATDKNLNRPVAIKVLHPHLLKHENLKQRFRREARMHAKLMHPNIVTLLSLYEDDTYMALVMEVVNGDDLKTFLRKNPNLGIKKKLKIAVEILKGLEAAHEFGMVHRDLKPANVLISERGEVKLLDFGLAKPEEGGEDLTQSGATVGSFRYMAPEQILNNPIDARTDLYAFGILLFYMLVGKLPFDATSNGGEFEIMEKQVRDPAPAPHELDASIPLPLSNLILKLLEKNKHHRPESAKVVRLDIENMLEQLQFLASPKKVKTKTVSTDHHTPTPTPHLSKHEIAQQWISYGRFQWQKMLSRFIPNINKAHTDLSIIALVFIMLGFASISVLSMAEDTAAQTQAIQEKIKQHMRDNTAKEQHTNVVNVAKVVPAPATKHTQQPAATNKPEKAAKTKPEVKPKVKTKPKAKVKPQVKKQPKSKAKPRQRLAQSITYKVDHKVQRKDKTRVSSNQPHEFRGGSHLFYPDLAEKGWLSTFKRGYSTILFENPVSLSKIVIHKASVGDLDFKHGFIEVEVKPAGKRKWKKVFSQKDKDIDKKVTISGFKAKYPSIDGVRVKFKTQDPITIGPIDLLP